ncbi:Crp/Fnr family transcriptional regulator [Sporolactobacillus shoreicorticis]|uniref:Crp/Fnr family transcriptional regulator n=1 Tax=Sporolactobacillus shoreicorticis TaxID=1923877 RepID=A0ABW5S2H9_9BACL|nr:Crp/Fnr family transcriptional regulator [Sporolactobacillus shoreicorticis]MCO7125407.1 Crp/Fnr family transcriptional regulator [Sporolactobacillus shoreicorticis]
MTELKATGWFQGLSQEAMNQIKSSGTFRTFQEKEIIFLQDDVLTHYFFVVNGLVRAFHQNKLGKKWIVSLFSQGDLFPHVGLADHAAVYPASAEALAPTTLFSIKQTVMQQLLHRYPVIQQQFTAFLAMKSQELINRYSDSVLEPALVQLVSLLKRLAQQSGMRVSNGWVLIPNLMTEQDMAAYIGVAPETVSRLLNRLYRERRAKSAGRGRIYIDLDKC